jgi:hypothetical protein
MEIPPWLWFRATRGVLNPRSRSLTKIDKGKPVARRGRKATELTEPAGLPNG